MIRMVTCAKLNRRLPGLAKPPMPGELVSASIDNISQQAWEMWQEQSRLLINHYGLNLADPDSRQILRQEMEAFPLWRRGGEAGRLGARGAERRQGQGRAAAAPQKK